MDRCTHGTLYRTSGDGIKCPECDRIVGTMISDIPKDGPGSHRADLAEMRAQTERADALDKRNAELWEQLKSANERYELLRDGYLLVADAVAPESKSHEGLASIARQTRQRADAAEKRAGELLETCAAVVEGFRPFVNGDGSIKAGNVYVDALSAIASRIRSLAHAPDGASATPTLPPPHPTDCATPEEEAERAAVFDAAVRMTHEEAIEQELAKGYSREDLKARVARTGSLTPAARDNLDTHNGEKEVSDDVTGDEAKRWRDGYLMVADALAPESTSFDQLAEIAHRIRAERDDYARIIEVWRKRSDAKTDRIAALEAALQEVRALWGSPNTNAAYHIIDAALSATAVATTGHQCDDSTCQWRGYELRYADSYVTRRLAEHPNARDGSSSNHKEPK